MLVAIVARVDGDRVDAGVAQLVAQRLGVAADGELRGAVGALGRPADQAEDARDVDDRARVLLEQDRQEGAGAVDDAPEVDVDDPLVVLRRRARRRSGRRSTPALLTTSAERRGRPLARPRRRTPSAPRRSRTSSLRASTGPRERLGDLARGRPRSSRTIATGQPWRGEALGERAADARARTRDHGRAPCDLPPIRDRPTIHRTETAEPRFTLADVATDARERILEAACDLIASDGIDDVRIARVATRARASTALVHHYFSTREELLAEALTHSFETAGIGALRARPPPSSDAARGLARAIEACLPLPGAQERDWKLWVELWLRAVRDASMRPLAADLYSPLQRVDRRPSIEAGLEQRRVQQSERDAAELADLAVALIDGAGHPRAGPRSGDRPRAGPAAGRRDPRRRARGRARAAAATRADSPARDGPASLGPADLEPADAASKFPESAVQVWPARRGGRTGGEPAAPDRSHPQAAAAGGRGRGDRRARVRGDPDRRRRRARRRQPAERPLLVRLPRRAAGRGAELRRALVPRRAGGRARADRRPRPRSWRR